MPRWGDIGLISLLMHVQGDSPGRGKAFVDIKKGQGFKTATVMHQRPTKEINVTQNLFHDVTCRPVATDDEFLSNLETQTTYNNSVTRPNWLQPGPIQFFIFPI